MLRVPNRFSTAVCLPGLASGQSSHCSCGYHLLHVSWARIGWSGAFGTTRVVTFRCARGPLLPVPLRPFHLAPCGLRLRPWSPGSLWGPSSSLPRLLCGSRPVGPCACLLLDTGSATLLGCAYSMVLPAAASPILLPCLRSAVFASCHSPCLCSSSHASSTRGRAFGVSSALPEDAPS